MYAKGEGVAEDDSAAVEWFFKAGEQGHASAQYNLGWMYANGKGTHQDYKEAAKWYFKAAEQEYAAAQNNLGVMYAKGEGTMRDYNKAISWFIKAAEQGFTTSYNNLGATRYIQGDYKGAIEMYSKALRLGGSTLTNLINGAEASLGLADSILTNGDINLESHLYFRAIHFLEKAIDKAEKENSPEQLRAVIHYYSGYAQCGLWNVSVSQKLMDYEKLDNACKEFEKCLAYTDDHSKAASAKWQVDNIISLRRWQVNVPRGILVVLGVLVFLLGVWGTFSKSEHRRLKLTPKEFLKYLGTSAGFIVWALCWTQFTKVKIPGIIELERASEAYQSTAPELAKPAMEKYKVQLPIF